MILNIGTDCTLFHGFVDYLNYRHRENGVKTSPFAGTWIYDENNRPGEWRMNYGSLGIVAELIETKFKGWDTIKKNFRGKPALAKYPIEFTYYNADDPFNQKATSLFLEILQRPKPLIFCSVWRAYKDFTPARIADDKSLFDHGVSDFSSAVQCDYDMKFFFIIDREHDAQRDYVRSIMRGHDMRYGILYNEIDKTPGRRWRQRFDAAGWPQALADVGLM